jgi:hypothetical protein
VWLEGSYRFDLFPDSLRVVGSLFLRADEDATIALGGLQVRSDRLRVRSGLFGAGLWMMLGAMIGCPVAVATLNLNHFGFVAALLASPGLGGVALTLTALRKTEFARLVTDAGVAAVVIPRTRAADGFDEFVDLILARIRECKGQTESSSSSNRPSD